MTSVAIHLDGDDITEHVEYPHTTFQSLADGNVGRAMVRLRDVDHTLAPGYLRAGKTLELFIGGTRQWDGWVFGVQRGWPFEAGSGVGPDDEPRHWTLIGLDRNLLFQKRFLYRTADPADASGIPDFAEDTSDLVAITAVLDDFIDLTGAGISLSGIEEVSSPGPFEDFTLGYIGAPLGVLFDDAAKITGAVFCVDPDRVLRYVSDRTPTAPRPLSDIHEDGATRYREMEAALDATAIANDALVWGAGVSGVGFGRYQDAGSISDYGRWQWGEHYSAGLELTLQRRAQTYVEGSPHHRRGHNEPVPVVTCVIHDHGFRAAQVADFRAHAYDYQENLPIRAVSMSFPAPTVVRYELEITPRVDTPFGIPDLWGFPPWDPRPEEPEDDDGFGERWVFDDYNRVAAGSWSSLYEENAGVRGVMTDDEIPETGDELGFPWEVTELEGDFPHAGAAAVYVTALLTTGLASFGLVGFQGLSYWYGDEFSVDLTNSDRDQYFFAHVGRQEHKVFVRYYLGVPSASYETAYLRIDMTESGHWLWGGIGPDHENPIPLTRQVTLYRLEGHANEWEPEGYFLGLTEVPIGSVTALWENGESYILPIPAGEIVDDINWFVVKPTWGYSEPGLTLHDSLEAWKLEYGDPATFVDDVHPSSTWRNMLGSYANATGHAIAKARIKQGFGVDYGGTGIGAINVQSSAWWAGGDVYTDSASGPIDYGVDGSVLWFESTTDAANGLVQLIVDPYANMPWATETQWTMTGRWRVSKTIESASNFLYLSLRCGWKNQITFHLSEYEDIFGSPGPGIEVEGDSGSGVLASKTFEDDVWYRFRLTRDGTDLSARVWQEGDDEPASYDVTDTWFDYDPGEEFVGFLVEARLRDQRIELDWLQVGEL